MVTTEQKGDVVEGTGNSAQTRNPQADPSKLPINIIDGKNLQTVINGGSLYANPQDSAVVALSGTSTNSIETLLGSETESTTPTSSATVQTSAFVGIVAVIILVGAFLIIRKMTKA